MPIPPTWTPEQDALVDRRDLSLREIADALGTSTNAVNQRRRRLMIARMVPEAPTSGYRYTRADDIMILTSTDDIAAATALGRTVAAIQRHRFTLTTHRTEYVRSLGVTLPKAPGTKPWTPEEDARLYEGSSAYVVAQALGRTVAAIHLRRSRLRGKC